MMRRLRLRLIDALMRAEEAHKEAFAIAIELAAAGDDIESPPASSALSEVPFRRAPIAGRGTSYSHIAVTKEKILAHLRKALDEAATDKERSETIERMRSLAAQGILEEDDVAEYL